MAHTVVISMQKRAMLVRGDACKMECWRISCV